MTDTTQDLADPEQVPIAVAMNRVMRDVGAIGKTRRNQGQNYDFRGVDDLMNALHPVLVRHGVFVVPTKVVEHRYMQHERTNERGKASIGTQVWITQSYRFYGPKGDFIDAEISGEGSDTADKSTNKANSSAYKYLWLQALTIPLEDMADGDRDHVEFERGGETPARGGGRGRGQASRSSGPREPTAANKKLHAEVTETLAGLDPERKATVRQYCLEHEINLTRTVPSIATLRALAAYVEALPVPETSNDGA